MSAYTRSFFTWSSQPTTVNRCSRPGRAFNPFRVDDLSRRVPWVGTHGYAQGSPSGSIPLLSKSLEM